MKQYRNTETFFDYEFVSNENGTAQVVKDGLREARARLNFFEPYDDGTDENIKEIVLVLKEAIKDMEGR